MSQMARSLVVAAPMVLVAAVGGARAQVPAEEAPLNLNAADWSGIRSAYEACRHAATPLKDGYLAHNPDQRWWVHFDGLGFAAEPETGGWWWGLELLRYGFTGHERVVVSPTAVCAAGQRLSYVWDATLEEWFVNDPHGLEHGYTVRRRPPREGPGPLTLRLAVRGTLRPLVGANGRDVGFLDAEARPCSPTPD